ncbi:MerR family transcriptional regulator [Hyphomicrobium denitrificans 1NES1]|uniref:MerR family transcriptional regulator n=1 Tax=Hyphomicrobium denitrificans 1NES1 TaxID=670307 RepID=N0BHU3_9HYPH|nr:helix-turn-helix domain-containing protein [Hyphomicrobium denitrificans]AGK59730.1 MerR family transcriptional regulator [Hyphomicrobium denitrificans 1NES1]
MKIGELARRTRTNAPTIRYYEEIGLLPVPARRDGGQRSYGDSDNRRLTFIRQCRAFGFPIEQVRSLVALTEDQDRSCTEARSIALVHLEAVREKLAQLKGLERNLADFIKRCDAICFGGPGPECVILKDMAEPMADGKCSVGGRKCR